MPVPPLQDHLCFSLYTTAQSLTRAYQAHLAPLGLTYPQYICMVALWQKDGITVGSLGEQVGLATNTLTPLLKRLEAAGLVTRKRDHADERRLFIHLTDQGRALQSPAAAAQAAVAKTTGLSPAESRAMKDWIDELRGTLTAASA